MAADDTAGYDSKEKKDAELEALKIEHARLVQTGNDRAKQVVAYAKSAHGVTLTATKAKAEAE